MRKRNVFLIFVVMLMFIQAQLLQAQKATSQAYHPKRINKGIELLEAGQPIYYVKGSGGYESGKKLAKTWADCIIYNMEHNPLDFSQLREFMRGLVDGGPTPSGHRTPAVIVVLPVTGVDYMAFKGSEWMVQQALAQGVHGVHLVHARDPRAVKEFVRVSRYPFQQKGIEEIGEGLRGWGSQKFAAWVWGVSEEEYMKKADVWPLNPNGEIMLGVKIEDRHALANAEKTLAIPGLCFAEHGPRDMGLSYGYLTGKAVYGVPREVQAAGDKVLALCKKYGLFFLDNVVPENVIQQIKRGVMIGAGSRLDAAEVGRKYTHRKMPW